MHQVHTCVLSLGVKRTWYQVCVIRCASISGHTGSHTLDLLQPMVTGILGIRRRCVFLFKVPCLRMYPGPVVIVTEIWCSHNCEVEASRRVIHSAVDPAP